MLNLIYKDFYQLRKAILLYCGLVVVLAMLSEGLANGAFGAIYIVIAVYGLTLRSAYYEDKDNALGFLRTLPLQAKTIVAAKYATVALLLLFNGLFTLAVTSGFHFMGTRLESNLFDLYLWATVGITVLLSIFLGVFFRRGYNQAVNVVRLVFIGFIFLPFILFRFDLPRALTQVLELIVIHPAFPYLFFSVALGAFLFSMALSIRGFNVR